MSASAPPRIQALPDRALVARLRTALSACAENAALVDRGRYLNQHCLVGIGAETLLLAFDRGRPALSDSWPPLTSWDFALRGSALGWTAFWRHPPPPGWHDLLALAKRGEMRIEGQLQPFMANLQYLKDLFAAPRAMFEAAP